MSIKLHIVDARSRSFQCDISGCRNRTTHLISKRGDVHSRPIHLCDECIRGIYALIGPESPTIPVVEAEPIPEPVHLRDGAGEADIVVAKKQESKTESKPNKAKKAPAKGGKK